MYVINAQTKDLLSFHPRVQEYLIMVGVPPFKKEDGKIYFRQTSLLKDIIKECPDWVRNLIEEGG